MLHVLASSGREPALFDSQEAAWEHVTTLYSVPEIDTEATVQQLPMIGGTFVVQPVADVYDYDSKNPAQEFGGQIVYPTYSGPETLPDPYITGFVAIPFSEDKLRELNRQYVEQDEAEQLFDEYLDDNSDSIFLFSEVYSASEIAKVLTPHEYDAKMDLWLDEQNMEVM